MSPFWHPSGYLVNGDGATQLSSIDGAVDGVFDVSDTDMILVAFTVAQTTSGNVTIGYIPSAILN